MTNLFAEFTDQQRQLVKLYKTNEITADWENGFAYELNRCLREGSSAMEESAIVLDELVKKWSAPSDLTLYRATSDADFSRFIDRADLRYPAFMSTSRKNLIRQHYPGPGVSMFPTRLEIHVPAGTNMLPMEANPDFGGDEAEVLLGRKGHFRIVSRREDTEPAILKTEVGPHGYTALMSYELQFVAYGS